MEKVNESHIDTVKNASDNHGQMSANLQSLEIVQQQRQVGYKSPPEGWRPGQSGNPGGRPKNRPQTTVILDRLGALTVDELKAYEPQNAAESACKLQILNAATNAKALEALPSWKEITDRTEGKAPQRLQLEPVDPEHIAAARRDEIKAAMLSDPQFEGCDPVEVEKAVERAFERQQARLSG